MNETRPIGDSTRRGFLHAGAGAVAMAMAPAASTAGKDAAVTLHRYDGYGWLRGFSVVPSWGARIEDSWWFYDPGRMREEIAPAVKMHANCIRLWIEFTAWMRDPDRVTASFLDAVAAIAEAGMKAMPCLFNRWHDDRFDYGGTYTETLFRNWAPQLDYVRALVKPLAADDRVLAWDLCNEPQAQGLDSPVDRKEYEWLSAVAGAVRASGARQPILIGTMTGRNVEVFAPLVDVLCGHPYAHDRAALRGQIEQIVAQRAKWKKPFLVNECLPGSLDDRARAEVVRFSTEMLAAAGVGWMGWALREGKAISTRRDRYDGNGLDGQGFHPFATSSGKLRGGLDFLTEPPARRPPWVRSL